MRYSGKEQQGFVSIVVSVIIMVILSLVTIGFAQIMAREQRQALDRQLSTQAFYAAESGVNDARVDIASYDKTCGTPSSVANDNSVRITCVTASPLVTEIKKDSVSLDPWIFPIKLTDAAGNSTSPDEVIVTWTKSLSTYAADFKQDSITRGGQTAFPAQSAWQVNAGLVKMVLIPFRANDSRQSLIERQAIALLNPLESNSGSGVTPIQQLQGLDNQYEPIDGQCDDTTGLCQARISMASFTLGTDYTELYMALSSYYMPSNFTVEAKGNGRSLNFNDVQAIIDSTGKTNDVLRRIQVRVPVNSNFKASGIALQAFGPGPDRGICKLWQASPVSTSMASGCTN